LQKNSLPNGLDSSTDFHALFKPSFEKKILAPSTVKKLDSFDSATKKMVRELALATVPEPQLVVLAMGSCRRLRCPLSSQSPPLLHNESPFIHPLLDLLSLRIETNLPAKKCAPIT